MVKNYSLQIRLNHDEQMAFFQAAAKQGMDTATWVRWVCLRAASETLLKPIEELVPREPPSMKIVPNPNSTVRIGGEDVKLVANPNAAMHVGDERVRVIATPNDKPGLGAVRRRSK